MKPQKVLYCEGNTDGTIGGSYFSLFYLTEALDRAQYEPIVVFHREHGLVSKFRTAGIETYVLERPKPTHLSLQQRPFCRRFTWLCVPIRLTQSVINFFKFFILTSIRYGFFLRKHGVKLVHLNNSITRNHEWMIAAITTRIPCITHERGINSTYSLLSRLLAKRLQALICISEAVRRSLLDGGITSRRMPVIYNGLDYERVLVRRSAQEIRALYGIDGTRQVVGIVGNIKEWKGQETVVRAVSLVRQHYPAILCMLVGDTAADDRYYEDRIRKFVHDNGLQNNVIFTGYQQNVADIVNILDVVIHASEAPEPFGRVLLEAMALKKPLIGARAGAVTEIIEEGITGYTFLPGNANDLAERIVDLLHDRPSAQRVGEMGFERLVDRFNIKKNTVATSALYRDILNQ